MISFACTGEFEKTADHHFLSRFIFCLCLPPHHKPRFKTAKDEEGKKESGWSPLFMAAASGNAEVARALITEHKADVHTRLREPHTVTGCDAGCTPLHMCMAFSTASHGDMLERTSMLLNSGADINAQSKTGM